MDKANVGYRVPVGIQYVFKEDVLELTNYTGSGSFIGVVLKEGFTWKELFFTAGTAKWQELKERTTAGNLWKQSFQAECLRDTELEWDELNRIATRPVLIRLVFKEECKLIGSMERPARLQVKTESSGGMKILVSMERSSTERAKWMDMPE